MKDDEIKVKIAEVAKREFLELGYVDASMRNISGKAGLTTGSLYNRFRDKAELFEYIVGDSVNGVFEKFENFNASYSIRENAGIQSEEEQYNTSAMKFIIDTMFDNYDSFDLIINKGTGSPYENFIDKLIDVATKNTLKYIYSIKQEIKKPQIIADITHLLNVALFDAITEIFRKHYTKEQAIDYMRSIYFFYDAGWSKLLEKNF